MNDHNLKSEVARYWKPKQLVTIPPNALNPLPLSEISKDFLASVGLPRSKKLENTLGVAWLKTRKSVPTIAEHFAASAKPSALDPSDWLILGTCYDDKLICVDPDTGRVYLVGGDPVRGFLNRFVNSSIEQFVYFLTRAMSFFELARKSELDSTEALRQELAVIDSEALDKTTHWWPDFLMEVDRGML